jgi:putative addiction module component (TIGR02574 family)
MAKTLNALERQALELTVEECAKLAELLLESVRSPIADIETALADEIEMRVSAFDQGKLQTYPAEDVFAEARSLSRLSHR